jgi:hypothetical protein
VVLCFNDDARQFRYVADQQTLIGTNALVVLRDQRGPGVRDALQRIGPYFTRIDSAGTIDIRRGGRVALTLLVYRANGLRRPYGAPADSLVR